MIIELILTPIFALVTIIINLIPNGFALPNWSVSFLSLIKKGLEFIPSDVVMFVFGNILFWLVAQFTWSIIEWVYKKIPGVD